jgi:hypothetical protein
MPAMQQVFNFLKRHKNISFLAAIFTLLVFYVVLFEMPSSPEKIGENLSNKLLVSNYTLDDIDSLTIYAPEGQEIVVKKADTKWVIGENNFKADSTIAERILAFPETITMDTFVSKNPENLGKYGVEDNQAYRITYHREYDEFSLIVGKAAIINGSQYVRYANSNEVYYSRSDLRQILQPDIAAYRDKSVLDLGLDTISEVTMKGPQKNISIQQENNIWHVTIDSNVIPEDKLNQDVISAFLISLKNLKASAFMSNNIYQQGGQSEYFITLKTNNGKSIQIEGKTYEEDSILLKTTESDTVFLLTEVIVNALFETPFIQ